jgi:hypothetical protein
MGIYKICVVGGWCGNQMLIIADHLASLLEKAGFAVRLTHHSVWENYSAPPPANLILQLLPAFSEKDTGCPVVNIKPLLADYNHLPTIQKVLAQVGQDFAQAAIPAGSGLVGAERVR